MVYFFRTGGFFMYRIYIVEDDRDIAGVLKKHIASWGFEVACSENFQNILAEFVDFDPQLVLMDITLPFFNGYHWCSEIRKFSRVPIVFLSSAADNMNMIMAMNMGADDFISKPFDLQVLTAKLQAILRRTYDICGSTGWVWPCCLPVQRSTRWCFFCSGFRRQ